MHDVPAAVNPFPRVGLSEQTIRTMYNIEKIRQDFPILGRTVHGRPLVYLDNAATTQKPREVVEAIANEYYSVNANVHRGVHFLSQQATELHEQARERVARFIGARSSREIVFTRGTTESLNLVAFCLGESCVRDGDEIILSAMEHHSNIVPWQMVCERKGVRIKVIPIDDNGALDIDAFGKLLTTRTRLVAVTHVSNVLGTVNPVKKITSMAHACGVPVLLDGAQSAPHFTINVQEIGCDFFTFSGHKVYGPTGIGILYGREEWLDRLPPYQGGGEMISHVSFEHTTYEHLPYKFEAGTPDYVGSHALARALDYVDRIGMDAITAHERELTSYAMERLGSIPGLHIYGQTEDKDAVVSFNVEGIHHLDMGTLLDQLGIAVRTGHHCAQPLMERYGVEGMVRASFGLYNTREEIDALVSGIQRIRQMF